MYYVYILRTSKNQLTYTGITNNLKRRINQHKFGRSKFTSNKRPLKLIWFSCFPNKSLALKFEKYLKSSSGFAFRNKHLIKLYKDNTL